MKKTKNNTEPFVIPGLIGIIFFIIFPLLDVLVRSFKMGGSGKFVGLDNYKIVLSNNAFKLAAKNNFWFVIISVFLLMIFSLFISIEVYNIKSNLIKFAFLIPLVIPSNAMAVIWKILFSDEGIINNILVQKLCWKPISFFEGKMVFLLFVGTFIFRNVGYNMLIWISGLSAIPKEIYDAAKVDGAGAFRLVWHITLPNLKKYEFIAAILSMVNSFKIFRELYLIAGSYPDTHIYQLQHVFNNWFLKLDIGKLTAGAILTAVVFFTGILFLHEIILGDWIEKLKKIIYKKKVKVTCKTKILKTQKGVQKEKVCLLKKEINNVLGLLFGLVLKIVVIISAIISVLPLVFLVCGTFMGENELYQMLNPVIEKGTVYARWHFIPLYPTLKNVIELLFDTPEYYVLFWNSIKIVLVILAGQLVLAVPAAWGLAKCKRKWGKWVFGLYMFCMILPFQVTMLSQYIVLNNMNLINTHWAIILPLVFSTFPIFIMYSSFEQIPLSVVEAAEIDGAGKIHIFLNMAIPIAKKGIISAVILGFLEYWNIVEQPVVFIKDKYLWPLSVYLPDIAEGRIGRAFTFALFSCIPSIIIFYMGKNILADGISIGSVDD